MVNPCMSCQLLVTHTTVHRVQAFEMLRTPRPRIWSLKHSMQRASRSSSLVEGASGARFRAPNIGVLAPRTIVEKSAYDGQVAGGTEGDRGANCFCTFPLRPLYSSSRCRRAVNASATRVPSGHASHCIAVLVAYDRAL